MPKLATQEVYLAEARLKHPDYDYSETVFMGMRQPVKVRCPKHGIFEQGAWTHLNRNGCPKCGKDKLAGLYRFTLGEFIVKAKAAHSSGTAYDYSKVVYENNRSRVEIICPKHGSFSQTAARHLAGADCPQCTRNKKYSAAEFFTEACRRHNNRYDYAESVFVSGNSELSILCKQHGLKFQQKAFLHLYGKHGCMECAREGRSTLHKIACGVLIDRASEVHDGKYSYPPEFTAGTADKIEVTCPKHGPFDVQIGNHIYQKSGCPSCANQISRAEDELYEFIQSLGLEVIRRDRVIIKPKELDLVVPSLKLGVEYNGMRWHTHPPDSHPPKEVDKWRLADAKGYQLLVIWEHDWQTKKSVVLHWLTHKLQKAPRLCGARQAELGAPSNKEAVDFYQRYHLQGAPSPGHHVGLRFGGSWVAMMTLTRAVERGVTMPVGEYYFSRLAFAGQVPGAASRLFKETVQRLKPRKIFAHSDNSYADGQVKEILGFQHLDDLMPRYRIWHPKYGIKHRTFWQKKNIPKRLAELGLTDAFNPEAQTTQDGHRLCGCRYAWDHGKRRWLWTNPG